MNVFEQQAASRYLVTQLRQFTETMRAGAVGGFVSGGLIPVSPDTIRRVRKRLFGIKEDANAVRWVTTKSGKKFPIWDRPAGKVERPEIKMRRKAVTFKRKDGTIGTRFNYNEKDRKVKSQYKFNRTKTLAENLNKVLNKLDDEVSLKGISKERMTAVALVIMAHTGARPGNARNATGGKNTFGVTTLQTRHVTIEGDTVKLQFLGKAGQMNRYEITDKKIAAAMREFTKGKERKDDVFQYADHSKGFLLDAHLRDRMKEFDPHYLPKDLRTAVGCRTAAEIIIQMLPVLRKRRIPKDKAGRVKLFKRTLKDIAKKVSRKLNNTPAVCLTAYIDPVLMNRVAMEMNLKDAAKVVLKEAAQLSTTAGQFINRAGYELDKEEAKQFAALRYLLSDEELEDALDRYVDDEFADDNGDDFGDEDVTPSVLALSIMDA